MPADDQVARKADMVQSNSVMFKIDMKYFGTRRAVVVDAISMYDLCSTLQLSHVIQYMSIIHSAIKTAVDMK